MYHGIIQLDLDPKILGRLASWQQPLVRQHST